jgi:long-chain fatty acid transport protein
MSNSLRNAAVFRTVFRRQSGLRIFCSCSVLGCAMYVPAALASFGNNAQTFGLSSIDVGSAQAFSGFHDGPSSVYYNPAQLAEGDQNQFVLGYFYADPQLTIDSNGGPNPAQRSGSEADIDQNNTVQIGIRLNLNDTLTSDQPAGFGLMMGIDDKARTLMKIDDRVSKRGGQFTRYGEKPLFLALGFGFEVVPGLLVGGGTHITIKSSAPVQLDSELDGTTSNETIVVESRTDFAPLLSLHADFGKLGCGRDCAGGLQSFLSFRGENDFKLNLDANATIPGTIEEPGLDLVVLALDAYQPDIWATGLNIPLGDNYSVALGLEQQRWSSLGHILRDAKRNAVKDQANAEFRDIYVPRIGLEVKNLLGSEAVHWRLQVGYAYERSPLKNGLTPDANLLDGNKHIFAIGNEWSFMHLWKFAHPFSVGLAYQYQLVRDTDFTISSTQWNSTTQQYEVTPTESVTAGGDVHSLSLSVTSRF